MYNKNLSDLFDKSGYDNKKYPWNFKHDSIKEPTSKIFYAIGDSWLFSNFFNRLFLIVIHGWRLVSRIRSYFARSHFPISRRMSEVRYPLQPQLNGFPVNAKNDFSGHKRILKYVFK